VTSLHEKRLTKNNKEGNFLAVEKVMSYTKVRLFSLSKLLKVQQVYGIANTNSGYYNYWMRLLTSVNLTTSNSFGAIQESIYRRKGMS